MGSWASVVSLCFWVCTWLHVLGWLVAESDEWHLRLFFLFFSYLATTHECRHTAPDAIARGGSIATHWHARRHFVSSCTGLPRHCTPPPLQRHRRKHCVHRMGAPPLGRASWCVPSLGLLVVRRCCCRCFFVFHDGVISLHVLFRKFLRSFRPVVWLLGFGGVGVERGETVASSWERRDGVG